MADWITEDTPLPPFRSDLQLYKGPDDVDGSPTYNLFDPIRAQYYKVSWGESLIIKHYRSGMKPNDLIKEIEQNTTLKISFDDIKYFFEDAHRHNLLSLAKTSESVSKEAEVRKLHPLKWLLFNYLYLRIPVVNPNAFLKKTVSWVSPLASTPAYIFYFLIFISGLYFLIGRFDEFIHTFSYFFNLEGALIYGLAITAIKIIHEFAHAYTAAYYGIHVPNMGIALIVLWPVLYTNVTDSWKLAKRSQRLAISIAGIVAELVLAGFCTLGWALTPPGLIQSVFFVVASVTWISTLVINLNPAMRWDGYYLLSDLWGIDNLQTRAFAITRWKMHEWLLGIKIPPPEEVSKRRLHWMIIYTIYTWIYRITLYIAIAVFVYYAFTKTLGVLLFIFEIAIFILWPLVWEFQELRAIKQHYTINTRLLITSAILFTLALWFFLPLPHEEEFPGITVPNHEQVLYVPNDSLVEKILVKRNEQVKKGQLLVLLKSPELDIEIAEMQLQKEILEKEIDILSIEEVDRPYIPEKEAELARIQAELESKQARKEELKLIAHSDGYLFAWDENLKNGQPVSKDQVLGKIGSSDFVKVICFVPENLLSTVKLEAPIYFKLYSDPKVLKGQVIRITDVRTEFLNYPQLASVFHGDLPTVQDPHGKLTLLESYYPIEVALKPKEDVPLRYGQIGIVEMRGPWKSKFLVLIRYLTGIFIRESGV